jgi:cell wall assembly regulator SMI1
VSLTSDLDHILEWHHRHNTPVARFIRPGLSEADILARTSRLPFQLPREFVDLYRWRDGAGGSGPAASLSFFEFHQFLPFDAALSNFQASYPIMQQFYELADWVMVFQDAAGDGYGVLGGPAPAEAAPVTYLFEGEGVQVVFDSLSRMIATVAAAFDEGVFTWSRGELHCDYERWGEVAHRLNPGIAYWRDYVHGA